MLESILEFLNSWGNAWISFDIAFIVVAALTIVYTAWDDRRKSRH